VRLIMKGDDSDRSCAELAHEFNNILQSIQPFAEIIRRRAGDDVKIEHAATQILASIARGRKLTEETLRQNRKPTG
jgi:signal transduction histidine kinase